MDMITLVTAKQKIIDLKTFPVNGGFIDGISMNDQLLYMLSESITNGSMQTASIVFNDDSFLKQCGVKRNVVLKAYIEIGGEGQVCYFNTERVVDQKTNVAVNVHFSATLNLAGGISAEVLIIRVSGSDSKKATIHVKTTPFA